MNKKGFTTVEVIVSFIMLSIILTSLITFSIRYRQRVEYERIKTNMIDFKNTITKVVYDDIIDNKYDKITSCNNDKKCANFIDKSKNIFPLNYLKDDGELAYIVYHEIKYPLPDNTYIKGDFELKEDLEIYHLTIKIANTKIDYEDEIILTIN